MMMPVLARHGQGFRERYAALAALGLIAGVAWWLAALPAAAQSKQPEAGAAAPPASAAPVERKQLLIVGSPLMEGLTDAVIQRSFMAWRADRISFSTSPTPGTN
jgi:hypothetical protein